MTESNLIEGQKLLEIIKNYERTLEVFENMQEDLVKDTIAQYLTAMSMVPNKDQMAAVMRNAVIESCKLCISQAREKFDSL